MNRKKQLTDLVALTQPKSEKKQPDQVVEFLKELQDLRTERNEQYAESVYGGDYKQHGHIMAALFPSGIRINGVADSNRFGVLQNIVSKLTRYCNNFDQGGHEDSLNDISVYSQMLRELDQL